MSLLESFAVLFFILRSLTTLVTAGYYYGSPKLPLRPDFPKRKSIICCRVYRPIKGLTSSSNSRKRGTKSTTTVLKVF
jgi:hypothetical protein